MKRHLMTVAMLALALSITATSCHKDDDNTPADKDKTENTTSDGKNDSTPVAEKVTITLPDGSKTEIEKNSKYTVSAQSTTDDGLIVKFFVNGEDVSGKEITLGENINITSKEFATITLPDGSKTEIEKDSKYTVSAQSTTEDGFIVKYYLNGEEVSGQEITISANSEIVKKILATITFSDGTKAEAEKDGEYTLPTRENEIIFYRLGDNDLEPGDKLTIDQNLEIKVFQVMTFEELQSADFTGMNEICLKITDVTNDNVVNIKDYLTAKTSLILDGTLTSIVDKAFNLCELLQSIEFPNSVTTIGEYAFANCSLRSIEIPNSVTTIGKGALAGCSFQTIVLPNTIKSIETATFNGCESLKSIEIPNSVINIGLLAFAGCRSLQSIVIPNSVNSIGLRCFLNCSSLQSIVIPNSVTSIESMAFCSCSSLQSIEIPNSVTSIGSSAFTDCSSLQSIDIPNSVTSIGMAAFYNCTSLQSITIKNSEENVSIGDKAFKGCPETLEIKYEPEN